MKKYWWKEFEDQNEIELKFRELKDRFVGLDRKRLFQVFCCCVFTKDFLMELFSNERDFKNTFEVSTYVTLHQWGVITYSNKTEKLWQNIDLYIKYCNPTVEFADQFSKKLKIVQFVDGYMKINGIPKDKRKGVSLGMRKRLGFYDRVFE